MSIKIDSKKCISCGKCSEICPNKVIKINDVAKVFNPDKCTSCGLCQEVCPKDTISSEDQKTIKEFSDTSNLVDEKYKEWSQTLSEILDLENSPISVKLIRKKDELPEKINSLETPLRYCEAIDLGFKGISFYLDSKYFSCPKSKAAIGIEKLPENFKNGKVLEKQSFVESEEAG